LSLMDQPRYLYDNILLFILEKKNTDALTNWSEPLWLLLVPVHACRI
jgi:hypothetical protein